MENKIRYQFSRLPIVLFLTITVVAASHSKPKVPIDNLYSPIYFGELNVTEGKQFWISCKSEKPIKWTKDGEPIEEYFIRRGDEESPYKTFDTVKEGEDKVESTLTVTRAALRHKGKYQCNVKHDNGHVLHVHPRKAETATEKPGKLRLKPVINPFDSSDDHEEIRFEDDTPPIAVVTSTVNSAFTAEVTESPAVDEFDDEKSHENFVEEPTLSELNSQDYETTAQIPTTTVASPTLPPSPPTSASTSTSTTTAHPTHATTHTNRVVHPTTHTIPSETQTHPDNHHQSHHQGQVVAEDKETQIELRPRKPLVLTCPEKDPIWKKEVADDFKELTDIPSLKNRYQLKPAEGNLIIEKILDSDEGRYKCIKGDKTISTFNVFIKLYLKVPANVYVNEEEKLEITCLVKGTSPSISWQYRKEDWNETSWQDLDEVDRFEMKKANDIENTMLIISNVKMEDRGYYACVGKGESNEDVRDESFVRVKDKLAALWPFLGIVAEVFVLCAIILIYEKRRNKTDDADSDTDQSPDQKNDHHRK